MSSWGSSWRRYIGTSKCFKTELISRAYLLKNQEYYLKEGELTLICKLTAMADANVFQSRADNKIPECRLVDNFELLLKHGMASDITICTENGVLRAHKVIFVARSSAFAAMFHVNMKEKGTNRVVIRDLCYWGARELLRFIYTGERPDEGKAMAAEKYNLQRLKAMCEQALASTITADIAVQLYSVAQIHNAQYLSARAINFVKEHTAEAMLKYMKQVQHGLLVEMFQAVVDIS